MMENYEKKYKEALERARDLHDNHPLGQLQTWMTCEKIFPELRESEDERIRKELIERFKWELKGAEEQDSAGCSRQKDIAMFKRGIAWLEKQGEQKPTDKVEPKFKVGDWITNGEYTWKVTDIKPLDYILQSQAGSAVSDDVSYVDEHFHLWNAWSEEDEKFLNYAISLTDDAQIKNFLKSLKDRVQPQPKHEWSEKDEEKLNSIIEVLDDNSLLVQWLKSLKPKNRWKPSEEQMKHLKSISVGWHPSLDDCRILSSLYNDLLKL